MSLHAPSRRNVVKAGIWTAPAVVAVSAAPAFAAGSQCVASVPYTVNWAGTVNPYTFTPASATFPYGPGTGTIVATPTTAGLTAAQIAAIQPLAVTVTNAVPTSGTTNRMRGGTFTYGGNTFSNMRVTTANVSGWGERGLTLAQSTDGDTTGPVNHFQTVTFGFDRPITSLSFAVGDIDATNGNHSDRVSLTSGATDYAHTTGTRGANLWGTGRGTSDGANQTAAGAYRPSGNAIVNDNTGTEGNVTLSYANAVTSVTVRFWNNLTDGGQQWIFLKNLTFTASTCK